MTDQEMLLLANPNGKPCFYRQKAKLRLCSRWGCDRTPTHRVLYHSFEVGDFCCERHAREYEFSAWVKLVVAV